MKTKRTNKRRPAKPAAKVDLDRHVIQRRVEPTALNEYGDGLPPMVWDLIRNWSVSRKDVFLIILIWGLQQKDPRGTDATNRWIGQQIGDYSTRDTCIRVNRLKDAGIVNVRYEEDGTRRLTVNDSPVK